MKSIIFYVKNDNNYHECTIFPNGPRIPGTLGCDGIILLITMTNGWKIKTNDLWYERFYTELDPNVLIGSVSLNNNNEITDESFIY